MHSMQRSFIIFLQFLRRSFIVQFADIRDYLINNFFCWPAIVATAFLYLQQHLYFPHDPVRTGTLVFIG